MDFELTDESLRQIIEAAEKEVSQHLEQVRKSQSNHQLRKNLDAPPPEEGLGGGDPADGGGAPPPEEEPAAPDAPPTLEELTAAYGMLPPEELKMHYLAAKTALFETMGGAPEGSPPGGPEGPPPEGSSGPGMGSQEGVPPEEDPALGKSERFESLEKSVKGIEKALERLLTAPVRKAVTDIAHIAKSEPSKRILSRDEITRKLTAKAADPTLAKSERSLINSYYSGNITVDQIEHLLQ